MIFYFCVLFILLIAFIYFHFENKKYQKKIKVQAEELSGDLRECLDKLTLRLMILSMKDPSSFDNKERKELFNLHQEFTSEYHFFRFLKLHEVATNEELVFIENTIKDISNMLDAGLK